MSWIEDEVSDASQEQEGEAETTDNADGESFEKQLQAIVAAGNATISLSLLQQGVPEIENVDLLERVHGHVDADEKEEVVADRLIELGEWDRTDDDKEADTGEADASEGDESEESDGEKAVLVIESAEDMDSEVRQAVIDGRLDRIGLSEFKSYADELDQEVIDKCLEQVERSEVEQILKSVTAERQTEPVSGETEEQMDTDEEETDTTDAQAEIESVFDSADNGSSTETTDTPDTTEETEHEASEPAQTDSEPDEEDWRDVFGSEDSGIDVVDAADMENRWSMLVWSEPGKGKTHFGYSTKEPVCIIDTEGKGHHLSDKFTDKTVKIFQPSNYDEALDALNSALNLLDKVYERTGRIGTVVVDSMSIMWEWSQQKYVEKFYRGKDVDEVEFSSAMGTSGQSDWKQIKRYHNVKFRQSIIDSPFHFVWTAMSSDDYEAAIENDINFTPKKPSGEKENEYKASEVLRLRENEEGVTVGELEKSDKIDHHYTDLTKPDFPKHKEVVQAIRNAEAGQRSIQSVESEFDIDVFEGNPRTARIAEGS